MAEAALEIDGRSLGEGAAQVARQLRRPGLTPLRVACVALCLDIPAVAVAVWFAQYAAIADAAFDPLRAAGWAVLSAVMAAGGTAFAGGFDARRLRSARRSGFRTAVAMVPVALLLGMVLGEGVLWPLAVAVAVAVVPLRLGAAAALSWAFDAGLIQRRAVIAGGGANAADLLRGLAARPDNDIRVYGLFDDRDGERSPEQVLAVPKLGDYGDLLAFVRRAEIDMVIVTLPLHAESRINWLLERLRVLPVDIRLSAFSANFAFRGRRGDRLIEAVAPSFAPDRRLMKRLFDLAGAALLIPLAAPVMLAAAVAIRLDSSGPILFRQRRHGYNDRVIEVLKFRTLSHAAADPDAAQIVTRHDPRVTRVGRFLRRSSIDELPQLFNVLRGDLSLVGPRPHALDARTSASEPFARLVEGYSARHRLPPGITGLAQIKGCRGEVDGLAALSHRIELDLAYIENWSIWLDLQILLRTPFCLLDTDKAY